MAASSSVVALHRRWQQTVALLHYTGGGSSSCTLRLFGMSFQCRSATPVRVSRPSPTTPEYAKRRPKSSLSARARTPAHNLLFAWVLREWVGDGGAKCGKIARRKKDRATVAQQLTEGGRVCGERGLLTRSEQEDSRVNQPASAPVISCPTERHPDTRPTTVPLSELEASASPLQPGETRSLSAHGVERRNEHPN